MVETVTVARALGGVVLLLANGFFVGIEFAMTRVRQFPEEEFLGAGGGLERAWNMTERLEIYLSGCQVGITICSVGLGVVAEPAVAALFSPLLVAVGLADPGAHTALAVGLALAVINLLHVVVGEQAPTYLGVERTKFVTRYGASLLYYWTKLMSPVIRVADWIAKALLGLFGIEITRSWTEGEEGEGGHGHGHGGEGDGDMSYGEVRGRMGEVLSRGGLPPERREEVLNALAIGETPVSDIMVPADQVVELSTERSTEENLARMREDPLVRFPLVGDSLEAFHGAVYAPDVLREIDALRAGETDLRELAHDPVTLPADTPVSEAIDRLQAADEELALVTEDGNGPVVGLVTATDAWEAITGDLEDPLDREIKPA